MFVSYASLPSIVCKKAQKRRVGVCSREKSRLPNKGQTDLKAGYFAEIHGGGLSNTNAVCGMLIKAISFSKEI